MKKPSKSKEISFGADSPAWKAFLNELRKQQVINEKVHDQRLMDDTMKNLAWDGLQKNIVKDGDTMRNCRTGEVLGLEVDFAYWKKNF